MSVHHRRVLQTHAEYSDISCCYQLFLRLLTLSGTPLFSAPLFSLAFFLTLFCGLNFFVSCSCLFPNYIATLVESGKMYYKISSSRLCSFFWSLISLLLLFFWTGYYSQTKFFEKQISQYLLKNRCFLSTLAEFSRVFLHWTLSSFTFLFFQN